VITEVGPIKEGLHPVHSMEQPISQSEQTVKPARVKAHIIPMEGQGRAKDSNRGISDGG
jgi:hypothetical protein